MGVAYNYVVLTPPTYLQYLGSNLPNDIPAKFSHRTIDCDNHCDIFDCFFSKGRASATPSLDVFITLLSLGWKGYKQLLADRKVSQIEVVRHSYVTAFATFTVVVHSLQALVMYSGPCILIR